MEYSRLSQAENGLKSVAPHPSPLPRLRRSGFAQAGRRGEGGGEGEHSFGIDLEVGEMFGFGALGKILILLGVFIIAIGVLLLIGEKIPWIGKLPGDIIIKKEKFTFYFPITTSIIISIILTLLFTLFRK
jgi:hypothetical protein